MNSSEHCRRGRRPLLLLGIADIVSAFRKMSTKPDQVQSAISVQISGGQLISLVLCFTITVTYFLVRRRGPAPWL